MKSERKKQEKYRIIILSIAFLLIAVLTVGIFTFRNYPNDIQEIENEGYLDTIIQTSKQTQVQKQKGDQSQSISSENSDYQIITEDSEGKYHAEQIENPEKAAPETLEESMEVFKSSIIYIPQTKSIFFNSESNALDNIHSGKIYYQNENGRLENVINQYENGISEELISYDKEGNAVDKLEIGYVCDSAIYLKCAVIFKNKISIYETKKYKNKKNEETVTEYLISPQLKFSKGKTYTKL